MKNKSIEIVETKLHVRYSKNKKNEKKEKQLICKFVLRIKYKKSLKILKL